MSTPKIFSHSKCFTQSQTCPIPVGNSLCGETNSLEIMKEFNKLYEGRMQQVDSIAGGDCLQEKIKLQQEWIQNLTQQNEMLVKAVQDLEYEATERVKQLEDKLHKNAQCLCEGEEMLKTKDRTLQELTQKLNYINSFGDVECMIKELQCRREECKSLKEAMADMRQVLTEEVASKHDQIIFLKRELQTIEETCSQAEKQIIFKDDIIKELRKDIKQLKQQFTQEEISKLTVTIEELQMNLEKTKIAQDEEEQAHHTQISKLNSTINGLEHDLKVFKQKATSDQDAKTCKICKGKSKVSFLEHTEVQANLIPKESELSKALNESKLKMTQEIERRDGEIEYLKCKVNELELALNSCEERASNLQEAVESKEYKDQVKKLSKQKRCYEEIINYFKHEMVVMAEQLNSLQELLTLSNESAQEESNKIMQAFFEAQTLNEKLSTQLCACEQKAQLENQMNQLQEAKISELQEIIKKKEIDLTTHDQAILNIHQTLNDSLKQNEALQSTIAELNETINCLREDVKKYEKENCENRNSTLAFQEQIDCYCEKLEELRKDLDEKTAQCLKLEMAYNSEKRALKMTQKQLHEKEQLQQERAREMMGALEEFKCKLKVSEENNGKLSQEYEAMQNQVAKLSRKEAIKDLEIKRYRKIVGELKTTMMELNSELNKNLAQKELKGSCKNASCNRDLTAEDHPIQDACLNCPCEVEFYQKMIDILKKSVIDLKQQLSDTQTRNGILTEEIKKRDVQLFEFEKLQIAFQEKLQESSINDQRVAALEQEVDHLRRELEVSTLQLEDVRETSQEINGSKCVQLACAQEEISNLKNELANVLDKQYKLRNENEYLQSQTTQLHCTITCLLEENKVLKEQADQYIQRLKSLNADKETLICKNKELLKELKSLQSTTLSMDKQQREALFKKTVRICPTAQHTDFALKTTCRSPCSLGSQGTPSVYDTESPPASPDIYGVNDWYSSTFKTESDMDSDEDYCVNTLENLTQQMRNSNKMWIKENRTCTQCKPPRDCNNKN